MHASHSTAADHRILAVLLLQGELSLKDLVKVSTGKLFEVVSLCSSRADLQQAIVEALKPRPDCSTDQLLGLMEHTDDSDLQQAIIEALKPRAGELRKLAGV